MPRILFLADSHIGLDMPLRGASARRRRGPDFLANHAQALEPARRGDVDLVIHGGDVFDRPDVPRDLAWQAYAPLLRAAERVPVFVVPGNHERSVLPHAHLLAHRNVHVFDRARTYVAEVSGVRIALSGFPFVKEVRAQFAALVGQTGWRDVDADVRLLCVHHCIEGATVGPSDYTFTANGDVIRTADVPHAFAALLSGHIHRHQVLTRDLRGRALAVPVLYPGSVERTALAEIGETKGYMTLQCDVGAPMSWAFHPLHARPMLVAEVAAESDAGAFERRVRDVVLQAPQDAVLTLRISGALADEHLRVLRAASLRTFVPVTMNVDIQMERARPFVRGARPARDVAAPAAAPQLELPAF